MITRSLLILLMMGILMSCVEEFQPELDEFDRILVVDGQLTTEEGPYTVRLSISSGLDIIAIEPVSGATVTIVEKNGPAENLLETEPGVYQTQAGGLQGVPGKNYKLQFSVNGKQYESDYELLKEPPVITEVEPRLEYKAFPDAPEEVPGIQFYVNSATSTYPEDYYLWTQEGTYKYEADYLVYFVFEGILKEFTNKDSLKVCYRTYKVGEIYTANTDNLSVSQVVDQPLHFLPATDKKLYLRYSMLTRQYSISQAAYDFWYSIEQQISSSSSLYSTQPYQIRGNVKNITDTEEPVLGYFLVAGVAENRIFVNRPQDVEIYIPECGLDFMSYPWIFYYPPSEWPIYVTVADNGRAISGPGCLDCREIGGQLEPPPFWEE